jgi:Tol biopolymer transport system component
LGISGDGRFIVFSSTSGLLAPGDTNQIYDIFVRDTLSGGTRLVTANRDGTGTQNGTSPSPASISDDGRFVAFDSYASNLSPLDTNALSDVFVRDMWNNSNILASVNRYGVAGGYSLAPLMTPDGKFVLFSSANRQLSSETAAVNDSMLYAFDISAKTNALTTPTNVNITLTTHKSDILSASKDRRVVAVGFGTYGFGAYDFQARNFLFSTNAPKYAAALSGDGKRLAYIINATGNTLTLKLYDLNARIQMASLSAGSMNKICVNSDGSRIAYELSADVAHQKPWAQVYVWDTASGSNFLASASGVDEVRGNGHSHLVAITPDGNRVVFNSQASDLVSGDENGLTDVFMRDLTTGKTVLLSENRSHTGSGNSLSAATALSADGTTVVFDSMASDLIANDFNNAKDVFFVRLPADEPVLRMIEVFVQADGAVRLAWISVPGRTYRVQFKDDCNDPAWKDMAEDVLASESTSLKLDRVKLQTQRYYRVMQLR